jgi:hypothetical protein
VLGVGELADSFGSVEELLGLPQPTGDHSRTARSDSRRHRNDPDAIKRRSSRREPNSSTRHRDSGDARKRVRYAGGVRLRRQREGETFF